MDAGLFEHFNLLIEKSYRITSRWPSTLVDETVENIRTALDSAQSIGREAHGIFFGLLYRKKENVGKVLGGSCAR